MYPANELSTQGSLRVEASRSADAKSKKTTHCGAPLTGVASVDRDLEIAHTWTLKRLAHAAHCVKYELEAAAVSREGGAAMLLPEESSSLAARQASGPTPKVLSVVRWTLVSLAGLSDLAKAQSSPEAWLQVYKTYRRCRTVIERICLIVGPLEDLLSRHGLQCVDELEQLARRDPEFAELLPCVWLSGIEQEVWERLQKLQHPPSGHVRQPGVEGATE